MAAAQTSVTKQNPALSFSVYIMGPYASPQSSQVCQNAALMSDARSLAQTVSSAAGGSAGAILNMEGLASPTGAAIASLISNSEVAVRINTLLPFPGYGCSLTVQFQLLGSY
jgi:hypothetical protein